VLDGDEFGLELGDAGGDEVSDIGVVRFDWGKGIHGNRPVASISSAAISC